MELIQISTHLEMAMGIQLEAVFLQAMEGMEVDISTLNVKQ